MIFQVRGPRAAGDVATFPTSTDAAEAKRRIEAWAGESFAPSVPASVVLVLYRQLAEAPTDRLPTMRESILAAMRGSVPSDPQVNPQAEPAHTDVGLVKREALKTGITWGALGMLLLILLVRWFRKDSVTT